MTAPPPAGSAGDVEALAEVIHARNEFDHDECDHGTYSGGHSHGRPYAMCERMAAHLITSDWLAAHTARALAADREGLAEAVWEAAHDEMCHLGLGWHCSAHQPIAARAGFSEWVAALAAPHDEATPEEADRG